MLYRNSSSVLPRSFPATMCARPSIGLIFVLCTLLLPAMAGAQDSKRGRLPDGRAYRIDKEGYRLVDRIAELEVTNDDLERQLRVLEDELSRVKQGRPSAAPGSAAVKEVDLLPPTGRTSSKLPPAKTMAANAADAPNCNDLVSSLYLKMADLEKKLADAKTAAPAKVVTKQVACDYQSPKNPLWNQVNELQNALMQGPSAEAYAKSVAREEKIKGQLIEASAEKSQLMEEKQALDLKRAELEKKIASQAERIAMQDAEIAQVRDVLKEQETMLASLQSSSAEKTRARAALRTPEREPAVSDIRSSAPVSTPTEIAMAKKSLKAELKKIQKQIMTRKNFIDRLKKKGRGVSVSPQALVSSKGASLDVLRRRVRGLDDASDARKIRLGLREISLILEEDIKTMQRLIAG